MATLLFLTQSRRGGKGAKGDRLGKDGVAIDGWWGGWLVFARFG